MWGGRQGWELPFSPLKNQTVFSTKIWTIFSTKECDLKKYRNLRLKIFRGELFWHKMRDRLRLHQDWEWLFFGFWNWQVISRLEASSSGIHAGDLNEILNSWCWTTVKFCSFETTNIWFWGVLNHCDSFLCHFVSYIAFTHKLTAKYVSTPF